MTKRSLAWKPLLFLLLTTLLLPSFALADAFRAPPSCFAVSHVRRAYETTAKRARAEISLPITVLGDVNRQLAEDTRALADALAASLPNQEGATLDVGTQVFYAGESTVSFLTAGRVQHAHQQLAAAFSAKVFDMETGARVTLADIVTEEGLLYLAAEARAQLAAYFPDEETDERTLKTLTAPERVAETAFTMSVSRLRLHYAADALYPRKTTLMHVTVSYAALAPYLTAQGRARAITPDCRLAALTFDDGPALGNTLRLLDTLRDHNASATFFLVGKRVAKNAHVVAREHDAGHTVASHNWVHEYTGVTPENVALWKALTQAALERVIGIGAPYMRAPGGRSKAFIEGDIGLPMLRWSLASGDSGNDRTPKETARFVGDGVRDGAIVLMHDINQNVNQYVKDILERLTARGFLLVTVDELMAARGVEMLPNTEYSKAY